MTRWWCSEYRFAVPTTARLILATGMLLSPVIWAHPDLLTQIEAMGEKIQAEPGNPEWLIRRGDLYRRHEEYAAAARDFQAARSLAPDHAELDFYQGRLALELGKLDSARVYLDHYLATHPQHPVAWRLQAVAGYRRRDYETAATGFGNAVRFSSAPSPALYREWVLALLAAGDRKGALDAVDMGLGRLGTEVSLLGLGADLALADRQAEQASDYLDRLPAGLRQHPPWRDRLQEAECLMGAEHPASPPGGCCARAAQRLDTLLNR